MDEAPIIGIDLGTTYSCAAVYVNEKPEIIPMKNGLRTMASCVSYANNCRLIGEDAKDNFITDSLTTIFDVKRFIGRRFNDPILQNSINTYPYEIINDNNNIKIKVFFKGEEKCFSPEEISAVILGKIRENAERYFKKNVIKAVVTVPAHFNDSQRQATKDAGRIAGLEVVRIINEPTAAALAYGIHEKYKNNTEPCNILIYDFGGGTFDVSIIAVDDGIFEVKATNGDTHLGGGDIDQRLVDYFVKEFNTKFDVNLNKERRAIRRLRIQCEKLKQFLSTFPEASIDLDALCNGHDFYSGITRSQFEKLCNDLFEKTLQLLQQALIDANLTKDNIDEVVLVGGTTRIPKVQTMVKRFFNNKNLCLSLNPDEAVAIGAAVQAAILDGNRCNSDVIGSLLLIDVNSLSLGVGTEGGVMSVIIPRNTTIPVEIQKQYETAYDNQTNIKISVYEGERKMIEENLLLGCFTLKGLKPAPRGSTKFLVTFLLNTDGILHVSATEKKGTAFNSLNIEMNKNRLSEEAILKMISEAERYRREDLKWEATVQARIKLDNYCGDTKKRALEEFSQAITEEHKQIILLKCDETQKWIKKNQNLTQESYEIKLKEVCNVCNPIIRLYL